MGASNVIWEIRRSTKAAFPKFIYALVEIIRFLGFQLMEGIN